jgi:hypothetical protein
MLDWIENIQFQHAHSGELGGCETHRLCEPLVFFTRERFGEDISNLTVGWAVLDFDKSFVLSIPDEMIFDVNVLGAIMSNRILNEFDCGLIIHVKGDRFFERETDFGEESLNPSSFLRATSGGNVFSFRT